MTHSFPPRRSSDLLFPVAPLRLGLGRLVGVARPEPQHGDVGLVAVLLEEQPLQRSCPRQTLIGQVAAALGEIEQDGVGLRQEGPVLQFQQRHAARSEEHTSELQSLMRISYAVFCLQHKKYKTLPSFLYNASLQDLVCTSFTHH